MRLLGVQPVFGLIEDAALRTVYNPGCYLFATVGGETMQENGVRCGDAHQLLVYLIGGELPLALLGLGLLSHAGPHVRIDDLCAGRCFVWVLCEGRRDAKLRGELFKVFVIEGADHYGIYITGEDAPGVRRGLPLSYLKLLRAQGEGVAAELVHPDFEGDAGAVGGLLEDHRERPAEERPEGDAGPPQGL